MHKKAQIIQIRVRIRFRVKDSTKPSTPGTLVRQKSFQREHNAAATLLLAHLSNMNQSQICVLKAADPFGLR